MSLVEIIVSMGIFAVAMGAVVKIQKDISDQRLRLKTDIAVINIVNESYNQLKEISTCECLFNGAVLVATNPLSIDPNSLSVMDSPSTCNALPNSVFLQRDMFVDSSQSVQVTNYDVTLVNNVPQFNIYFQRTRGAGIREYSRSFPLNVRLTGSTISECYNLSSNMEMTVKRKVCQGYDGMRFDEGTGTCVQRITPPDTTASNCFPTDDDKSARGGFVNGITPPTGNNYGYNCNQKGLAPDQGNILHCGSGPNHRPVGFNNDGKTMDCRAIETADIMPHFDTSNPTVSCNGSCITEMSIVDGPDGYALSCNRIQPAVDCVTMWTRNMAQPITNTCHQPSSGSPDPAMRTRHIPQIGTQASPANSCGVTCTHPDYVPQTGRPSLIPNPETRVIKEHYAAEDNSCVTSWQNSGPPQNCSICSGGTQTCDQPQTLQVVTPAGECGNACATGSRVEQITQSCTCGSDGDPCCSGTSCNPGLECDPCPTPNVCSDCGDTGESCCCGACNNPGDSCVGGVCVGCGGSPGDPCCGGSTCSNPSLTCDCNDTCQDCGDTGESCCCGACNNPTDSCVAGTCVGCGVSGQACCPGPGAPCTEPGTTCVAGTCTDCGDPGEPCCPGDICIDPTTTCDPNLPKTCTGCGYTGAPCCPGCDPDHICESNICIECGGGGQACCPDCDPGYTCVAGTCESCGGFNEACCPECDPGLTCNAGQCIGCGAEGAPCCPSDICNTDLQCTAGTCDTTTTTTTTSTTVTTLAPNCTSSSDCDSCVVYHGSPCWSGSLICDAGNCVTSTSSGSTTTQACLAHDANDPVACAAADNGPACCALGSSTTSTTVPTCLPGASCTVEDDCPNPVNTYSCAGVIDCSGGVANCVADISACISAQCTGTSTTLTTTTTSTVTTLPPTTTTVTTLPPTTTTVTTLPPTTTTVTTLPPTTTTTTTTLPATPECYAHIHCSINANRCCDGLGSGGQCVSNGSGATCGAAVAGGCWGYNQGDSRCSSNPGNFPCCSGQGLVCSGGCTCPSGTTWNGSNCQSTSCFNSGEGPCTDSSQCCGSLNCVSGGICN